MAYRFPPKLDIERFPHLSVFESGSLGGVNQPCHGYTGGVTKHEGRVVLSPQVIPVIWTAKAYASSATYVPDTREQSEEITDPCIENVLDLLSDLLTTTGPSFGWLYGLEQYGVGNAELQPGLYYIKPSAAGDPTSLTDNAIKEALQEFIKDGVSQGLLSAPPLLSTPPMDGTSNQCYVLFLPNTATVTGDAGACGYHSSLYYGNTLDANVYYAVIFTKGAPTPPDKAFVDSVSYCISHELAEMFTNPDGRGWYVDSGSAKGCEIGDVCEQLPTGQYGIQYDDGLYRSWTVEQYWSQADMKCIDPSQYGEPPRAIGSPPIHLPPIHISPPKTQRQLECEQLETNIVLAEQSLTAALNTQGTSPTPSAAAEVAEAKAALAAATNAWKQSGCIKEPLGGPGTPGAPTQVPE